MTCDSSFWGWPRLPLKTKQIFESIVKVWTSVCTQSSSMHPHDTILPHTWLILYWQSNGLMWLSRFNRTWLFCFLCLRARPGVCVINRSGAPALNAPRVDWSIRLCGSDRFTHPGPVTLCARRSLAEAHHFQPTRVAFTWYIMHQLSHMHPIRTRFVLFTIMCCTNHVTAPFPHTRWRHWYKFSHFVFRCLLCWHCSQHASRGRAVDTSLDASVAGNSLCAPPPVNLASGFDSPTRRRRVSRRLVVLANGHVCVWATRGRYYHQVHMTFLRFPPVCFAVNFELFVCILW